MEKPNSSPAPSQSAGASTFRSGVAARMAGLAVETLRVWERRYNLSEVHRSEKGQRLYTQEQVNRLRLLKRLVDQGHAIGTLADLPMDQLVQLGTANAAQQNHRAGPIRVALIGPRLRERLDASGRVSGQLDICSNSKTLDDALPVLPEVHADVLVIELSELDQSAVPMILQAREAAGATAVVVLYRFCPSATIRHLRMQDCLVVRVPADMGELVLLCRTALTGQRAEVRHQNEPLAQTDAASPRFDDDTLSRFATAGNSIDCECPRHLAEILLMVGSFERYSAKCASRSPEDEQLHQHLARTAGQARLILEDAMETLARAEGFTY
ncbi:MerR family transcriptional regulator [uncultured Oxalicibacterium sp.]|uniref:MerR family transcriptional regulator n=1 Tax=uncultured Oxalicibacterium sp. TaxID=1168540 RepID=UPI0025D908DB|nr:MerR family transcriptional regulator [uncultured Oxalicibacterium sp.]